MARVVLIIDSDTGKLVDVAGNPREGERYRKFVGRMLSADGTNLDYGVGGGSSLTVSKGGYNGDEIKLLADVVKVPGTLMVNGKTVEDVVDSRAEKTLKGVVGTPNQIVVTQEKVPDPSTGKLVPRARVSLDPSVVSKLDVIGGLSGFVSRGDIAEVVEGLSVNPGDDLADVKDVLGTLLNRLKALAPTS